MRCVRNGFDPVEARGEPVFPRRLGYFGTIDPRTQHPDRLWTPLRILRDRGRPWELEILATPGGGGSAQVEPPEDLRPLVRFCAPLPYAEALAAMQRMAALVVLAWEGRGGETQLPGKLYEYVGSGRPVLVCAPPGFEARSLVERAGVGLGAWGDTSIVDALERIEDFVPDEAGRQSLSRGRAAEEVLALFEAAALGSARSARDQLTISGASRG
jgi:hypothetical protein